MLLPPEPWTLEVRLSPDPGATEHRETGYPAQGPVQIFSCLKLSPPCLAYSVAETDVQVELGGLGGELISRRGMK